MTEAGLRLRNRLIGWLAAANAKSGCLTKWDALLYQAGPACESFLGRVYACNLVPTEPETARAVLIQHAGTQEWKGRQNQLLLPLCL